MEDTMTDLMLRSPKYEIQYFIVSCDEEDPTPRPLQVSAKDFGYEIDEQELAEELIAPLLISFPIPQPPDVDPDDFERVTMVSLRS
jgi:hypothetical protein